MDTLTTNGIKVSIESAYRPSYSKPEESRYIFSYQVTIENVSTETVQLLRRHWTIQDANGVVREVEGEGVVGKQPILRPGEKHQYVSWCHLMTEIGRMYGTYLMINTQLKEEFQVSIPEFQMVAPFVLN